MNRYTIKGRQLELITIHELAKLVKVSPRALREWEKKGILPKPCFNSNMHSPLLGECKRRLYHLDQAKVLFNWLQKNRHGKGILFKESAIESLQEEWGKITEKILEEV